jgi:hypothetical protein
MLYSILFEPRVHFPLSHSPNIETVNSYQNRQKVVTAQYIHQLNNMSVQTIRQVEERTKERKGLQASSKGAVKADESFFLIMAPHPWQQKHG